MSPCAWHRGGCPEQAWVEGRWPKLCRHHNVVVDTVLARTVHRAKCKYECGHDATTLDEACDFVCKIGECDEVSEQT